MTAEINLSAVDSVNNRTGHVAGLAEQEDVDAAIAAIYDILDGFVGGSVFVASTAGDVALTARGHAAQTANLQEWQDSAEITKASINSLGWFMTDTVTFDENLDSYIATVGDLSTWQWEPGAGIFYRRDIDTMFVLTPHQAVSVGPDGLHLERSSDGPALTLLRFDPGVSDIAHFSTAAGVPLFSISYAGIPQWAAAANTQPGVGSAGAGSALPATPEKYLKIKDADGTVLVVPAYLAV